MDETQDLALRALRELLDDPERNDWDDLLAANRALIKAIETGEPMTRRNARIVAEYLREAGCWGIGGGHRPVPLHPPGPLCIEGGIYDPPAAAAIG